MFTEEQQILHKHLPNRVTEASDGQAVARVLTPPHVPQGAFLYGISPRRVPSDVHPVPSRSLREALASTDCPWVFLLDGSGHLRAGDIRRLLASVRKLKEGEGLALPAELDPDAVLADELRVGCPPPAPV